MSIKDGKNIKIIDLSQEIYVGNSLWPGHQKTFIWVNETHEINKAKTGSRVAFSARNLLISEHCSTHSDAVWEYLPEGPTIDKMPLNMFCGSAVCLDLTGVPDDKYIEPADLEEAEKKSGQTIGKGDIVLLHTGCYNRWYKEPMGEPKVMPALGVWTGDRYQTDYAGLSEAGAEWLAKKGVVNIGIDAPAIDHPDDPEYSGHWICGKYGMTNTENMANLDQVVNKRFLYVGVPLNITDGSGSPIRAVALLDSDE
ncbi:MAG: cyclase family protein [Clostridiales bacterium]|nr:cyclase family protein [Clostridiales bacterium]MDD7035828.1 cyclase family protein [Bacillota bacterium]